MIDIDNLTVKQIKHIQSLLKGPDTTSPHAAWIADDGRFMNAVCEGKLSEVEPFPDDQEVIIGRGAVLDAVVWKFNLPTTQK